MNLYFIALHNEVADHIADSGRLKPVRYLTKIPRLDLLLTIRPPILNKWREVWKPSIISKGTWHNLLCSFPLRRPWFASFKCLDFRPPHSPSDWIWLNDEMGLPENILSFCKMNACHTASFRDSIGNFLIRASVTVLRSKNVCVFCELVRLIRGNDFQF